MMTKKTWILLLMVSGSNIFLAQSQTRDSTNIKRNALALAELQIKIENYHGRLNAEEDVDEKLKLYEQFSSVVERTSNGMFSGLAVAYANSNKDSATYWLEKIKAQDSKVRTAIVCAKSFAEVGNPTQAIKLYQSAFDYFKTINNMESNFSMAKAFYDYLDVVPVKGNEQTQHAYLKYLYEGNENSFPTDLGYYWNGAEFDARKLLFYNYAQALVYRDEVKAAAQVIADAFQSGSVPDSMLTAVEKDFEHIPKFNSYLKEFKFAGKAGFQKGLAKLLAKRDVNGNVWDRSTFKGKYVMIDFWGSWCLACRLTHPHLIQLYEKYKDKGLELVGVGYERAGDIDRARTDFKKAIGEDKLPWIQYLNNENAAQFDAVKSFGIAIFPTKILVNSAGKEIARFKAGTTDLDKKLKEIFGF